MPVCSNLPSAGVGSMRLSKGVSQRPEAGPGSRAQNGQLHARRSPVPSSRSSQRSSVWSLVFQKWLWGSESDAQPGSPQPAGGGGGPRRNPGLWISEVRALSATPPPSPPPWASSRDRGSAALNAHTGKPTGRARTPGGREGPAHGPANVILWVAEGLLESF